MLKGLDISAYERGLDLRKLDFDFCIVKATEGVTMVQGTCDPWVQQCIQLNRKWGFYHVMNSATGIAQATWFVDNCKNYFGYGIPFLDIEGEGGYPNDPGRAYDFCKYIIDKTGVKPILYMNKNCLDNADWSKLVELDCDLWVANYWYGYDRVGYDIDTSHMTSPKPWPYAALWQFTSSGRLDGWNSDLDLDMFFGDESAWDAYARSSKPTETDPDRGRVSTLVGDGYRVTIERTE